MKLFFQFDSFAQKANRILQFLAEAIQLLQRNCAIRDQVRQIKHNILLSEFELYTRFSPILTDPFIQRPKTFGWLASVIGQKFGILPGELFHIALLPTRKPLSEQFAIVL